MAQSLSAVIIARFIATLSQTIGAAPAVAPVNYPLEFDFTDGAGANKVHQCWSSLARSINASSSETLDLSGSLTDAFANSITFTKVKAILVAAAATNVNDVVVGGVGANGWVSPFGSTSDKVNVKPGGMLLLVAPDANGLAVTAGTADLLKVANGSSGSAVAYDIMIIGE